MSVRQWNAPYAPISNGQAMVTAYHSRLRTGSTLLIQPIGLAPVPPNHTGAPVQPAPALAHAASFGPSRRTRGGVVNYAELEDDEDETVDVEGEPAGPSLATASSAPNIVRGTGELDRNYLGAIPPAKFVYPTKASRIHQQYYSEAQLSEAASKRAVYIPIRLELNTETHQIRDSFLWNVNETLITPAAFAHQLCVDLNIPTAQHAELIASAISAQCEEHRWIANVRIRPRRKRKDLTQPSQSDAQGPSRSVPVPKDPRIEAIRANLQNTTLASGQSTPGTGLTTASVGTSAASPASDGHVTPAPIAVNIDDEMDPTDTTEQQPAASDKQEPVSVTPVPQPESKPVEDVATGGGIIGSGSEVESESDEETDSESEEPDCRVIVSLDLQISTHHLHDHIEWDLSSPLTPEHFARTLCADTGLAGEAVPLVACALREALLKHTKDALQADGSERLRSVFRDWQDAEEYFPRLELLSAEELERRAMERERAIRRMRRETQRWGQASVSRKRFRER